MTLDLRQGRLPPFQQVLFSPTIAATLILLLIGVIVFFVLYSRANRIEKAKKREENLKLVQRLLLKRGGSEDDLDKVLFIFNSHPRIDPSAAVMVQEDFLNTVWPLMAKTYGKDFAARIQKFYFPPPKDTNAIAKEKNLKKLVEGTKNVAETQAVAAMIDLMDATLKPGVVLRLTFEGIEGGFNCLTINHSMHFLNATLPANYPTLLSTLQPGLGVEGTFESGPSLMAFTSSIVSVVGGSMPFCRLSVWKNAWEVRKRDSVRLDISLDIDFQHISTAAASSIRMSQLDREMGAVRPGKPVDLSLGGCGIETSSRYDFSEGDFIRFSTALMPGLPPATLLGAIVDIRNLDPEANGGMIKHIGIQFLALDDLSQRLLARAMRQLQEVSSRKEWVRAQRLLEEIRRHNMHDELLGPDMAGGSRVIPKQNNLPGTRARSTTVVINGKSSTRKQAKDDDAPGSHSAT